MMSVCHCTNTFSDVVARPLDISCGLCLILLQIIVTDVFTTDCCSCQYLCHLQFGQLQATKYGAVSQ